MSLSEEENRRLIEQIRRTKEIEEKIRKDPHAYFFRKSVLVRWIDGRRIRDWVYVETDRNTWNDVKVQPFMEAVMHGLSLLGIGEQRGYDIQECHEREKGIHCVHVYRISNEEPLLGVLCKNYAPKERLTIQEAQRAINHLKHFKFKLLLFAHRSNIFKMNAKIKTMLKEAGIHLAYIGNEIIPAELYYYFTIRRDIPWYWDRRLDSGLLFLDDEGTLKLAKKKLFRILHDMAAVKLRIYRIYPRLPHRVSRRVIEEYEKRILNSLETDEEDEYEISRSMVARALVYYFPRKKESSSHVLLRKRQWFRAKFLDKKTVELFFSLPIKGCIYHYCKYRPVCTELKAIVLSSLPCPRKQHKKILDKIVHEEPWKRLLPSDWEFILGECIRCGKHVTNREEFIRIGKHRKLVHRGCLQYATLLDFMKSTRAQIVKKIVY